VRTRLRGWSPARPLPNWRPASTWARKSSPLGAVSSPEVAVSAVAQGRCAGVARPARVAGVDRRPDACGGRVPPGGGPGC